MEFHYTSEVQAPPGKLWAFVTDAESVASCTPGVESVRILEPARRCEVGGVNAIRPRSW